MKLLTTKTLLAVCLSFSWMGVSTIPCHGQATIYDWIAADDVADWNSDANWNSVFGNFVPDAGNISGEQALINNGRTALVAEDVPSVAGLEVRNGTVDIAAGGQLATLVDDFGDGALTVGGAGTVHLSGSGSLSVAGDVRNSGTIRLTGGDASFAVAGDFISTGTLAAGIQSGSLSPVVIDGTANLAGQVLVEIDGAPDFGESWDLLTAGTVSGRFETIDVLSPTPLPRGLTYQVHTSDTRATLAVGNALIATVDDSRAWPRSRTWSAVPST